MEREREKRGKSQINRKQANRIGLTIELLLFRKNEFDSYNFIWFSLFFIIFLFLYYG